MLVSSVEISHDTPKQRVLIKTLSLQVRTACHSRCQLVAIILLYTSLYRMQLL